jgi:hypothetical protein
MEGAEMRNKRQMPDLERALEEWRLQRQAEQKLSQPARARIFREGMRPGVNKKRIEAAVPLFFPASRLALATVLPLLVISIMTAYLLMPGLPIDSAANGDAPILQAVRQGDEVVFTIANGGGQHLIRKSNSAKELSDGETFVVSDGAFRERLDTGDDLVFYRID